MNRRPPSSPLFPYPTLFQSDDAELLGFAEHAEPLRRVEPVHVTSVIQGVRAIHAAERASVCELGDERIRTVLVVHGSACIDRKSTRLNSSHSQISYAVFCLK